MNRPDAALLAKWSYYLSFATSGLLTIGFLLGFMRSPLSAILWLAFLTSAIGAFMGWAARSEFKRRPTTDPKITQFVRQGWRVNLGGFIVLILSLIIVVIMRLVFSRFGVPIIEPALTPTALLWFRI